MSKNKHWTLTSQQCQRCGCRLETNGSSYRCTNYDCPTNKKNKNKKWWEK